MNIKKLKEMKKVGWLIVLAVIVLTAVMTNPKKEVHTKPLSKMWFDIAIEKTEIEDITIGNELIKGYGKQIIDSQIDNFINYHNYVLFSTCTTERSGLISIGLFGNVKLLISKNQMEKKLNETETKQSDPNDYIQRDGYKELNIKNILKRAKERTNISGIWEESEYYKLKLVELEDNKVLFQLDANIGTLRGLGILKGNVITYKNDKYGECEITITIEKEKATIMVIKNNCGLGNRSNPNGVYLLKRRTIPKFNNAN